MYQTGFLEDQVCATPSARHYSINIKKTRLLPQGTKGLAIKLVEPTNHCCAEEVLFPGMPKVQVTLKRMLFILHRSGRRQGAELQREKVLEINIKEKEFTK